MYTAVRVVNQVDGARFCGPGSLPGLGPEALARHEADDHWLLVDAAGDVAARCSLWWTRVPGYRDERLGLIGHYAARDAEAGSCLLQFACTELAGHGCTLALGPMDGSTWRRYRLLTERGDEPQFFLEPDNPDDWPGHFLAAGFLEQERYVSTLTTDLGVRSPLSAEAGERAAELGIHIRALAMDRFEDELRAIYHVALPSFQHNVLYSPIGEDEFLAMYRPLARVVRPELALVAERRGAMVGFLFAIPDLLQAQRGERVDTVVLKTIAVAPDYAGAGLGTLLMDRCHAAAHALGYTRAIHALMHEGNRSLRVSRHYARPIRRYTLFGRPLAATP